MHWQNSAEFGPNFHLYRTGTVLMYGTTPPLYEYTVRVYGTGVLFWRNSTRDENRRPEATRMMI